MGRPTLTCILFLLFVATSWDSARADVEAGMRFDDGGVKSFHFAVREHYGIGENDFILITQHHVRDCDLPVIFYIARRARVAPGMVLNLRLSGRSWMEITGHFGLTAAIFHVPFAGDPGPPYGKAWGHFKNTKRAKWGTIVLADADVVNLVNLKFISGHYGYSPAAVAKMRLQGENFVHWHAKVKNQHELKVGKHGAPMKGYPGPKGRAQQKAHAPKLHRAPRAPAGKGQGKGRGKGK